MIKSQNILIIDKDPVFLDSFSKKLKEVGHVITPVNSVSLAMKCLKSVDSDFSLILLDTSISKSLNLITSVSQLDKNIPIIILTQNSSIDFIVKALNAGAFDHVKKPINMDELTLRMGRAVSDVSLKKEVRLLQNIQRNRKKSPTIIGVSSQVKKVMDMIDKIAKSDAKTVLVMGASGTGKELVAKSIHYNSVRSEKPFIILNCAAIPNTLLETELMGYEKGAYTDATMTKKGLLEMADGGTLFLDEIGDMDISIQAKLLRILEDRTFRRVGGVNDIRVNVRIITATNVNLDQKTKEGKFRSDLFYRLLVVPICLPSLKERKDDIPVLIDFFIHQYNREFNKSVKCISKHAMKILENYSWPGNIRELKNVIERALILEDSDQILPEHLPYELMMMGDTSGIEIETRFVLPAEGISMEDVEKSLVRQALIASNGKQVAAAKLLRMTRDAFRRRMKKYEFR